MEALDVLISSVPKWHLLLDDLNGKIASRQYELAQLDDYRPPTRSLKNKGSTESLRPKDKLTNSPINDETDLEITLRATSGHLPTLTRPWEFPALSTPTSPALLTPTKSSIPPPLLNHSSSPGPAAGLQRRTSNRLADSFIKPQSPPMVRKRKTASVTSNDSQTPKYRTRSMIIVYYDSAVQNAFEELVKHISACRNAMRKGKMAARMADMRRIADLEAGSSDEEDSKPSKAPALDTKPVTSFINTNGNGHVTAIGKDLVDADGDSDMEPPKLQFVSTRRMGPSRDMIAAQRNVQASGGAVLPPIPGMLRSSQWRSPGLGLCTYGSASIFDELDTGLEWCQSMCEHAAHQFLRDGECSLEIENIKDRLNGVKEAAEKQQNSNPAEDEAEAKTKAEEKSSKSLTMTPRSSRGEKYDGLSIPTEKGRSLKPIQMRRTSGMEHVIEADLSGAMEVDEGFGDEDEEEIPKLVWRSARDI